MGGETLTPVVIAENGRGLPVIPVAAYGVPAIVSARGLPIVIVDPEGNPLTRGTPMIIANLPT